MIAGPSFDPAIGKRVRADRALERQIRELAGGAGQMLWHEQVGWESVTFSGTRHRMTWAFGGTEEVAGGEAMIALLPDHEFDIPGHLVADAAVTGANSTPVRLEATLELLLLEEG